jgi:kumamolisin
MAKVPLKGSERAAVPGARVLAPAEATERLEVSVILRRRGLGEMQSRVAALASGGPSRGVMSRDEFARVHGADPADISAVRAFAAGGDALVSVL